MDRNTNFYLASLFGLPSLSARRAWIEISASDSLSDTSDVALRKESVDRNHIRDSTSALPSMSLSARRAWIEISIDDLEPSKTRSRSPQGERG